MNEILQQTFLGNTIENYSWFAGLILAGILFKRLISKLFTLFIFRFIKKFSTGIGGERLFGLLKKPMEVTILLIVLYIASDRLNFPAEWKIVPKEQVGLKMFLHRSFSVALVCTFTWIILRLVDYFALTLIKKASQSGSKSNEQLVPFLKETIKILISLFSVFFMLGSIFHLNVTSLIAGLGIGGLAIALAAKESLENLLGSFTIFFDKPFVTGDYIKTGNIEGNVERIGFRSTRLLTPEKSFITVPNKKLVEASLDNITLRTEQKVNFTISLDYSTSSEKLKNIIADIKKVIDEQTEINAQETRITLYELGPDAIRIRVLYFVLGNNTDVYLSTLQKINLAVIEIVNKQSGIFSATNASIH